MPLTLGAPTLSSTIRGARQHQRAFLLRQQLLAQPRQRRQLEAACVHNNGDSFINRRVYGGNFSDSADGDEQPSVVTQSTSQRGKPRYSRVMLKISGEALQGELGAGVDPRVLLNIAQEIKEAVAHGIQVRPGLPASIAVPPFY